MGGAAGIKVLMGMIGVKFAAVLIGATGIGLLATLTAVLGLIVTLAGLGIQTSAVRDIAIAVASDNPQAVSRKVHAVKRLCWITGLIGMLVALVLSPLISQVTFGHAEYRYEIAILGIAILFANLSSGQMALIQGMRRIGDLALINIVSAMIGTLASVALYATFGLRGIAPALVAIAAIQLALSWHYARQLPVLNADLSWRDTFTEASGMVRLGLVFMWSSLMVSAVIFVTVALITQQQGLPAVGLYSAAFALSGAFVSFVLGAMGADYYPRLTAMAHDEPAMCRLVNEQTEIGLLLALPGLLATLALAPWAIRLLYTPEFLGAVVLLQWFILGCLGRVISWPLGFVMLALGKGRWFFVIETGANLFHVALVALGLFWFGVEGVAVAFFVLYLGYIVATYLVSRYLIGFRWSIACTRLAMLGLPPLLLTFVAVRWLPLWPATVVGCLLTIAVSVYALRSLVQRIGHDHRIFRLVGKVPGAKALCGLT